MTLSNRNFDRLPDCEGTQPWSDKTMSKYYYNCVSKTPLSEDEGASFAEWMEDPNHPCRFARHPEGFLVFLRPAEILTLDEYSEGDPYAVAENLDKPFHKLRVDMTIDLLAQVIGGEPGLSILDVACGEGHITAAIHRAFPTAKIFAFDGSLSAIRSAIKYEGITFALANAYDLPYAPDCFDCIVCNNIWEHVPDPLRLLEKIARLLKPNGYLIISTPSRYRLENLLRVLVGKAVALGSRQHVTEYSVGQVIEQLRYAGFEVEKTLGQLLWVDRLTFRSLIKRCMGCFLAWLLRLNRSHHILGSTAFYLAKKRGLRH